MMKGDGRGRAWGGKNFKQKEDEDKILLMVQKSGESPVDMVNSLLFTGFDTSQVVSCISSINSMSQGLTSQVSLYDVNSC